MSNAVLELQNVAKSFRQGDVYLEVLKNVSLKVKKGETVALVGPSGCGKSTLLHVAGLLEKPNGGNIIIDGKSTHGLSDKKLTLLRRNVIGFVYQYHHLLAEFSALENVMMPNIIAGKKPSVAETSARKMLKSLGLEKRINHRPAELSGGEQQRVAIARALANNPSILMADEPTGNLDPATADAVFHLLMEQVEKNNLALFIVTHNPDIAKKTSRTITLKDGALK